MSDLIGWQHEGHWTTQDVALVPSTPMVWRHHTWQISAVQWQLFIRDSGYALQREATWWWTISSPTLAGARSLSRRWWRGMLYL